MKLVCMCVYCVYKAKQKMYIKRLFHQIRHIDKSANHIFFLSIFEPPDEKNEKMRDRFYVVVENQMLAAPQSTHNMIIESINKNGLVFFFSFLLSIFWRKKNNKG